MIAGPFHQKKFAGRFKGKFFAAPPRRVEFGVRLLDGAFGKSCRTARAAGIFRRGVGLDRREGGFGADYFFFTFSPPSSPTEIRTV